MFSNEMHLRRIKVHILLTILILLAGCGSLRQLTLKQELRKISKKSPIVADYFMGLSLYDPETKQYLININADKYYTPASNTKILTLAAWLSTSNEKVPSYYYKETENSLVIAPLGDPTFLHPDFPLQTASRFLFQADFDTLFVIAPPRPVSPFGSGWAWDDYNYAYQPERAFFPLYGNTLHAYYSATGRKIVPDFFEPFVEYQAEASGRSIGYNLFELPDEAFSGTPQEIQVPFKYSEELMVALLQDTLHKPVKVINRSYSADSMELIYGYDRLPVLASMMLNSDNFLAEHLLLNAQLFEKSPDLASYLISTRASVFRDIPQELEWVDGSGLSRYNMFTPMSLVKVLEVIYRQLSWQEINLIFPKGGVSGTLKNWYAAETPYVFAKTGTLRHNHCLSGYIVTKSGKRLIFSMMNNHYTVSSTEVKQEMQKMLEAIRDAY